MKSESAKNTIPGLSKNATTVLEKRYLRRDVEGKVLETPADMFRRVAETIAAPDKKFDKKADVKGLADSFYKMMTNFEFLPNSPTLMNAGPAAGPALGLFRPAGGRLHGRDLRCRQVHRPDPQIRRRHRLLVFAPAPGQ